MPVLLHALPALLLCSLLCSVARAQLSVASDLSGAGFAGKADLFVDESAALEIGALSSPAFRERFRPIATSEPGFGFSGAAYWFRFTVENSGAAPRDWMLEVAYPHLDYVTLFVPRTGGEFERRQTGDMLGFATRDMAYRNFVFTLQEPARAQRTYYLRVASSGSVTVPLKAWTVKQFVEHQYLDWAGLCVFYGVVWVMSAYNACVYLLTRQREYLYYVNSSIAMGIFQFTLAGHTFQFLCPNQSWLANHLMPACIGLCLATGAEFARYDLPQGHALPRIARFYGLVARATALLALASFALPYHVSVRLLVFSCLVLCVPVLVVNSWLARSGARRAQFHMAAWGSLLVGVIVYALRAAGVLPTNFFTTWSTQIGATVQLILLASGLADSINTVRAELARQVVALQAALTQAEEATQRAEQAKRVKDEFMATMSHEFRTPLNAIINIPQGLLEQFPLRRYAQCTRCDASFELDDGELLTEQTPCPECATLRSLSETHAACYAGQPEHTARYLRKIERSGLHLLQLVNDVLDFSQMGAGQLRMSPERFEVTRLVKDVLDEMSPLAEPAGLRLHYESSGVEAQLCADPLRIRQVLINLIGNAIKFSDGRGTVTVQVEEELDAHLFSVADQGIGIAPDKLEAVFASFEQVHKGSKRKYGGTGLGLSIARSLVRMHGGELWVESTLGEGSTFFFRIPKAQHTQDEGSARRPPPAAPHSQPSSQITVGDRL